MLASSCRESATGWKGRKLGTAYVGLDGVEVIKEAFTPV